MDRLRFFGGLSSSVSQRWVRSNAPGSMLRARFRSREVGCREPTTPSHRYRRALLRWQRQHVPRCGAWRVTEPLAKFACEMSIVAKATDVGDLAYRSVLSAMPDGSEGQDAASRPARNVGTAGDGMLIHRRQRFRDRP